MCSDSKCCEFCGGPNHLTVRIKTGHNTIIPVTMCCDCFRLLMRGEKSVTAGNAEDMA